MPAPDLPTLFDFETQIQPVLQAAAVTLGIAQTAVQDQTQKIITSGRLDIELTMGAATGHLYTPKNIPDGPLNTGNCFEAAWNAVVSFNVVTDREVNAAAHAKYRSWVRSMMIQYFQQFGPDVLPYHQIAFAKTLGTRINLVNAKEEDVSQLNTAVVIYIRPGAWPAPY